MVQLLTTYRFKFFPRPLKGVISADVTSNIMLPGATEPEALSRNQEEGSGEFYEVEMSVDERFFDGDINEISEGNFVSFKYLGEHGTYGPPLNPKVSKARLSHPTDTHKLWHLISLDLRHKKRNSKLGSTSSRSPKTSKYILTS